MTARVEQGFLDALNTARSRPGRFLSRDIDVLELTGVPRGDSAAASASATAVASSSASPPPSTPLRPMTRGERVSFLRPPGRMGKGSEGERHVWTEARCVMAKRSAHGISAPRLRRTSNLDALAKRICEGVRSDPPRGVTDGDGLIVPAENGKTGRGGGRGGGGRRRRRPPGATSKTTLTTSTSTDENSAPSGSHSSSSSSSSFSSSSVSSSSLSSSFSSSSSVSSSSFGSGSSDSDSHGWHGGNTRGGGVVPAGVRVPITPGKEAKRRQREQRRRAFHDRAPWANASPGYNHYGALLRALGGNVDPRAAAVCVIREPFALSRPTGGMFSLGSSVPSREVGEHLAWYMVAGAGDSRDHGRDRAMALGKRFEEAGVAVVGRGAGSIAVVVLAERGVSRDCDASFDSDEELGKTGGKSAATDSSTSTSASASTVSTR